MINSCKTQIKGITIVLLVLASTFSPAQAIYIQQAVKTAADITSGAQQTEKYLPLIKNKNIAIVANASSVIGQRHLVDSLVKLGVAVKKIFFPEHGFRGDEDAGESLKNSKDAKTGLPCISLYGSNKKPKPEDLKNIDIVIFDMQDVGVRFYTYISTLHYVMEACAENKVQLMVLDRPNPNGFYVDGPVLEMEFKSFVGIHPVPIVHGMTIGEYAQMINGEGWLAGKLKCELTVIPVQKYEHADYYDLPIKPSPNLPNRTAVCLYPSLCLFEGTIVSVGRGTDKPFQQFGYPEMPKTKYTFTPQVIKGVSEDPPYKGKKCFGYDVSEFGSSYVIHLKKIYLYWLINAYKTTANKENFFNNYFNRLAGNNKLKQQIKDGLTEEQIHDSWENDLKKYKEIRKKYLLYKDFE